MFQFSSNCLWERVAGDLRGVVGDGRSMDSAGRSPDSSPSGWGARLSQANHRPRASKLKQDNVIILIRLTKCLK